MLIRAVHPGQASRELEEMRITPRKFARQIVVPPNRVSHVIVRKRSVTADTALHPGHWFGSDPQFWLNLQAKYELVQADRETGDATRHLSTTNGIPGEPSASGIA